MKYLAPCLVLFALFTDPSGSPVYVAKSQAIAVMKPGTLCKEPSNAKIITSNGFTCVREIIPKVIDELEKP